MQDWLLDVMRLLGLVLIGAGVYLLFGAVVTLIYAGVMLLLIAAVVDYRKRVSA